MTRKGSTGSAGYRGENERRTALCSEDEPSLQKTGIIVVVGGDCRSFPATLARKCHFRDWPLKRKPAIGGHFWRRKNYSPNRGLTGSGGSADRTGLWPNFLQTGNF